MAAVLAGGMWLYGMYRYANHDRIELIDEPHVVATIERECASMTQRLQALRSPTAATTPQDRAAYIRQQDQAVREMVRKIRTLGERRLRDDLPSQAWLQDWEHLADARDQYAAALVTGRSGSFNMPQADGSPITKRMGEVGLDCAVPSQLTSAP